MLTKTMANGLLQLGLIGSILLGSLAAEAEAPAQTAPNTAVIDIATPREGNLLQLRGLAGRGTATFRMNDACYRMPVRFVSGDFSGRHVRMARRGPIRIVIRAQDTIQALAAGQDLVSDMVRVTDDPGDTSADLYLAQGLTAATGFVINPGRNLSADLFGARLTPIECDTTHGALPSDLSPFRPA